MINCQDVDRNNGKVGNTNLTVRLLVSCSGSGTTKLLGLVSPRVSDQQGPIKLDEDVLDLLLALLVNKLLVVGDQGLGEGLPDGVHLGHVSAALHTDADVNVSKSTRKLKDKIVTKIQNRYLLIYTELQNSLPVLAKQKHGLHQLELESLGLHLLQGAAIDLQETLAPLAVGHGGGGLLAAEHLDRLDGLLLVSHRCFCNKLKVNFKFDNVRK